MGKCQVSDLTFKLCGANGAQRSLRPNERLVRANCSNYLPFHGRLNRLRACSTLALYMQPSAWSLI